MMQFSITGAPPKLLKGADFTTPKFAAQMGQVRGRIGRMPFVMDSAPGMERIGVVPPPKPVVYLLHFDGTNGSTTFINSGGGGQTVTAGGSALSTTSPKFGTASLSVPGGGSYAVSQWGASVDLDALWTIEAWVKAASATVHHAWLSFFETDFSGTRGALRMDPDGTVKLYDQSGAQLTSLSMGSYAAGTWSHRAIVRNGSTVTTYKDGVSQASANIGSTPLFDGGVGRYLFIGTSIENVPDDYFDGYIDEFRLTNTVAIYTANFTPPTAPFPNP